MWQEELAGSNGGCVTPSYPPLSFPIPILSGTKEFPKQTACSFGACANFQFDWCISPCVFLLASECFMFVQQAYVVIVERFQTRPMGCKKMHQN